MTLPFRPEDLVDRRRELDVVLGTIPVVLGQTGKRLPTLKIGPVRPWKARLGQVLRESVGQFVIADTAVEAGIDLVALGNLTGELMVDLVLEYDVSGSLGGREWIEANADDAEIYEVFRTILGVHYPFANDARTVAREILVLLRLSAPSTSESSPSSPSPSGDSTSSGSPSGSTTPS